MARPPRRVPARPSGSSIRGAHATMNPLQMSAGRKPGAEGQYSDRSMLSSASTERRERRAKRPTSKRMSVFGRFSASARKGFGAFSQMQKWRNRSRNRHLSKNSGVPLRCVCVLACVLACLRRARHLRAEW